MYIGGIRENSHAIGCISWSHNELRKSCRSLVKISIHVETGAHRPPLPTAVVCPARRRRRLRLAITTVFSLNPPNNPIVPVKETRVRIKKRPIPE